jgi:hypothetical protein
LLKRVGLSSRNVPDEFKKNPVESRQATAFASLRNLHTELPERLN